MNSIFYRKVNWTLIAVLAVFYLIFELLYIFKVNYFVSLSGEKIPPLALIAYFIDWLLVTLYMALISINTSYLLEKKIRWIKIIPLHLFFSVLISLVIRLVIDFYQVSVGLIEPDQYSYQQFINGLVYAIDVNYIIYFAMIFVIYAFYYLQQVKISEKQKAVLETQLLDSRIKMLTSQLHPHFLFNTLNSISSLIDIDQEKAQDTLADLSDFLREILYHIDSNFVSIRKELEILNPYLNILRTRFFDKIQIKVDIPENLLEAEMPTLLLQPLIENAVKHGSWSSNSILIIKLDIFLRNTKLIFKVANSGKLKSTDSLYARKGMGLSNIKDRLESIYGKNANFKIEQLNNETVCCTIEIPYDDTKAPGQLQLEQQKVQKFKPL